MSIASFKEIGRSNFNKSAVVCSQRRWYLLSCGPIGRCRDTASPHFAARALGQAHDHRYWSQASQPEHDGGFNVDGREEELSGTAISFRDLAIVLEVGEKIFDPVTCCRVCGGGLQGSITHAEPGCRLRFPCHKGSLAARRRSYIPITKERIGGRQGAHKHLRGLRVVHLTGQQKKCHGQPQLISNHVQLRV